MYLHCVQRMVVMMSTWRGLRPVVSTITLSASSVRTYKAVGSHFRSVLPTAKLVWNRVQDDDWLKVALSAVILDRPGVLSTDVEKLETRYHECFVFYLLAYGFVS